jgi:hypothetical protein
MGRHTFRLGFDWLDDRISDLNFQGIAGPINGAVLTNTTDLLAGGDPGTSLTQAFPLFPQAGIRMSTFGGYIADDWKVSDYLTVSLNLRLESYLSPTCDTNCFSRLSSNFTGVPDPTSASTPGNQFILPGQQNAFPDTQSVVWEPRVGIAWRPFHSDISVVRTGAGIFADQFVGSLAEQAAFNAPNLNAFTVGNGSLVPGVAGSLFTTAALANRSLLSQFNAGGSFNSISAAVPGFAAPNFYNFPDRFRQPTYYKWNFQIQQELTRSTVLILNYSGMQGNHIAVSNPGLNTFCGPAVCPGARGPGQG